MYIEMDRRRKSLEITGSGSDLRYLAEMFKQAAEHGAASVELESKGGRFLIVRDGSA